ncbi:MAG: methyltransferase [Rubritepida sp.]|nr:methyltransferase [Rubritepida sp.]
MSATVPGIDILVGDSLEVLRGLPAASVQCCVTSPPYFGLRDYGQAGQIGLEPTPDAYVARLVEVFAEVRRVLRPDGTCWLNLGDCYASAGGPQVAQTKWNIEGASDGQSAGLTRRPPACAKPKDLLGIPWMVAFALRADGWYLRSDIVWAKPNPMPESVKDRPTNAHEHVFLLTKSERYFYDRDAIREEAVSDHPSGNGFKRDARESYKDANGARGSDAQWTGVGGYRNARNVWTITPQPFKGAHFATMPPALVERCIKAGSRPGDAVLDPFFGAGTTGLVARRLGRSCTGIELSPAYAEIARARLAADVVPVTPVRRRVKPLPGVLPLLLAAE